MCFFGNDRLWGQVGQKLPSITSISEFGDSKFGVLFRAEQKDNQGLWRAKSSKCDIGACLGVVSLGSVESGDSL